MVPDRLRQLGLNESDRYSDWVAEPKSAGSRELDLWTAVNVIAIAAAHLGDHRKKMSLLDLSGSSAAIAISWLV